MEIDTIYGPKDQPSVYNGHSIDIIIKNFAVNPDKYKK